MVETEKLMELIADKQNLNNAYLRVRKNKGSYGVDNMTIEQANSYLREHKETLINSLLNGTYKPHPVRWVEIPKPNGGTRLLGIPTVIDRIIQQAILFVITPIFEEGFSDNSYGFRPGRSQHMAIEKARSIIEEGHKYVIDIDLEKFFDRVNHDKLMARVARKIKDKRLLKLIRAYLNSGIMIDGLVHESKEGTSQGGPLSPLLSNIVLDDLDKELEKRGHRFVRYADDCNIFVKSVKSGNRVMDNLINFIENKMKLKVNKEKSAVDIPRNRTFLGVSFYN